MSTSYLRDSSRPVALLTAALLTVLMTFTGQSAQAGPTVRPGKATNLSIVVSKPGTVYRLATSWKAGANTTSYRVKVTDKAGTVLDSETVTSTGWLATVKAAATTTVRLTVTPFNGRRRGPSSRLSATLPDLTAPTGAFEVTQDGSGATVTQTALADDVSTAGDITRVMDWGDGTAAQAWTSGTTIGHTYVGQGLWRPTVTLTDGQGNSAVLQLRAVVVGDDTAPTGTFSAGPAEAWASFTRVRLTQLAIHDDFSADADIVRTVRWGDGAVTSWAGGSVAEHVYELVGPFTPSVELVDDAGNASVVEATAVSVSRDVIAPTVTLRLPKRNRAAVTSWSVLKGTVTDVGTGVRAVRVKAVQKRGTTWYSYGPNAGSWVAVGSSKRSAWRKAGPAWVPPTSAGAWRVPLRHLATGRLVYKVSASDQVRNVSKPIIHRQRLTRS